MKKTLVALAALATVGAAFAQSSVTLYGRIDASLASTRLDNAGFVAAADTNVGAQIRSGAHTGSRWGLRGSEDLGGGLKANFQLEQGFNVDDGTASAAARQFHRQAWVGLSGGFGSLQVGRQYDPIDNLYGLQDPMGYSGYSAMGYAFNKGVTGDVVGRQDNSVLYSTPAMGGFGLNIMWAPGENKTPATSAGKMYGFYATYANGPMAFSAGWQRNENINAIAPKYTNYLIGGQYDLTVAKLFAQFEGGKLGTGKDTGWQLGAVIPFGAPSLTVSYARENTKVAGTKTLDSTGLALMGQYPLSKRTYVYAAYLNGERDPVAAGLPTEKDRRYGVGVVHNF